MPSLALFYAALLLVPRVSDDLYRASRPAGAAMIITLQFVVIFAFHWWTQHWLLSGRVGWRVLMPGSLLIAVADIATIRVSHLLMDGQIVFQTDAYGPVGVAFVLSVWLGVFSAMTFFAAFAGTLVNIPGKPKPGSPSQDA